VRRLTLLSRLRRQLGDVGGDPPCFVHGDRLGRVGIGAGLAPIDICKRLPVRVLHYVAAINSLYPPRRRKATVALLGMSMRTNEEKRPQEARPEAVCQSSERFPLMPDFNAVR
jgi:hypothetical protein